MKIAIQPTSPLDICDKNASLMIKGLCMILIILHHLYVRVLPVEGSFFHIPCIGVILGSGGYLGTGVFFMLSGYGLYHSMGLRNELKFSYLLGKLLNMGGGISIRFYYA